MGMFFAWGQLVCLSVCCYSHPTTVRQVHICLWGKKVNLNSPMSRS